VPIKVRKKPLLFAVSIISAGLITYLSAGDTLLNRQIEDQINRLVAGTEDVSDKTFTLGQIDKLPEPVQRYFKYSLEEGQHYINYVKTKHGGTFRQNEGQGWMPIEGKEYFTAGTPGFVWLGKIKPYPLIWVTGLDSYIQGKGNFQIKLLSVFTVANAKGKELDEGELMRWLGEAPLFPTSLLPSKHVRWEGIDSNSAKAIVEDKGLIVDVVFHFNEKGEITQLTADRHRSVDNSYSKEKWVGYYRNYIKKGNMMIPQEIEVAWRLKSGDFSYAKFKINEIEFRSHLPQD
jgi:hypothetical protein